jgi:hypothetical protein
VIKLPFFGATGVSYVTKSDWAENTLSDLLMRVAYPNGSTHMDFDNIVRFLGVEFDYSIRQAMPIEELQVQIGKESNEFFASNRHVNSELFFKFIHVFYQLVCKNQASDFVDAPIYIDTLMRELPA